MREDISWDNRALKEDISWDNRVLKEDISWDNRALKEDISWDNRALKEDIWVLKEDISWDNRVYLSWDNNSLDTCSDHRRSELFLVYKHTVVEMSFSLHNVMLRCYSNVFSNPAMHNYFSFPFFDTII